MNNPLARMIRNFLIVQLFSLLVYIGQFVYTNKLHIYECTSSQTAAKTGKSVHEFIIKHDDGRER